VACAGPRAQCAVPPGVEVVDVRGAYVAPGLIDAHVHYSQTGWVDGRPDALDVRAEHPYDSVVGVLRDDPRRYGRAYLCSGVTATWDVGGYPWTTALAAGSEAALDMPRVRAAGPLLSTIDHWVNLPTMRQFVYMRDDSTVRATVRAQAATGAAAIKVWYIQLPDTAMRRTRPLLMAAGDEARKVGLPLIVHATELATARDAVAAGAAVLVHSVETDTVDDAFVAALKRAGTIVIPTLTVREGYADVFLGRSPASRYPLDCVDRATRALLETQLPEARRARGAQVVASGRWDRARVTMEHNLRRLVAAGVPIAMGTDAGNPGTAHGPSVYREMEALQRAGMRPADVFASSTIVAARAMGLERELGSLAPGKEADLVVFDADPSADAANARRVRMVMRRGALYGRAELEPGTAERSASR
jgi:imidazolonepropionase-like amidohydrolase